MFGPGALPQHIDLQQLGSINIGEDPRAIGDDSANPGPASQAGDGHLAAGAVDVVRIKLLQPDPTSHLADVRIGHMEAQALVPAGGVRCAAPPPPPPTSTTTSSTTTSTTSTSTTSTTTPPSSTTTTTVASTTTTTTEPPSTTTTTTEPPVTPNAVTTTTQPPPTTTTTEPPAQVLAQSFTQTSPAIAVSAVPTFTG